MRRRTARRGQARRTGSSRKRKRRRRREEEEQQIQDENEEEDEDMEKKENTNMEEGKEENVGEKEEEGKKRPGKTHWLTSRRARMRRRLYIARVYTYVPSPLFSSIAGQFTRLAGLPKEIIPPARGPSHRQRAPTFLLLPMPCMVSCPTAEKSICQNPNH